MKVFRTVFTALLMAWLSATATWADEMDSVSISLLTCSPHEEVYSLYGHTAIRVEDRRTGQDFAVNYGVFNFHAPHFMARFVFGLTDYEMGVVPFDLFCREYQYYGSSVTQQVISLTPQEKRTILDALATNYQPENRIYRYNYFYDNCTTRARDMILNHLEGHIHEKEHKGVPDATRDTTLTFRQMVHQCCAHHPWVIFGIDLLLGVKADRPTTKAEQQFLPRNLMEDFGNATRDFHGGDGREALVDSTFTVVESGIQVAEEDFPLRPRTCALILLAVVVAVTLAEICTRKTQKWLDALLMLLCGAAGIVLFLMLFSQHPTVSLNLQLLLLNPLPLFFVWPMLKGRCPWQYKMWIVLICLFFAGAPFQHYAEGMLIVASSLLIRNIIRLRK